MPRSNRVTELRAALGAFATGEDRSPTAIARMSRLVELVEQVPWRSELNFVLGNYSPASDATGEAPLAALAQLALDDWASKKQAPRWLLRVPDNAKGLEGRWQDDAGVKRAAAVIGALMGNGDVRRLSFGEHEGRVDLRGLRDPGHHPHSRRVLGFENLDLSGARLGPLWFHRQKITNCRFDGTAFADLRLWSTPITDSSFRGADLGPMVVLDGELASGIFGLFASKPPRHLRTDFSGAKLADTFFQRGGFEDCDFSNARLNRSFFSCDLVRCRFAGLLDDVAFDGRPREKVGAPRFEDVDLSGADLHYVGFRALDLDRFRLPDDPRLRVIANWPCVRRLLTERYPGSGEDRPIAVRLALIQEAAFLPDHGKVVLELATIEEDAGRDGVAELVAALDAAEADCNGSPEEVRATAS